MSELTGRTQDEALAILHDCDYDANLAVVSLLENQGDQVGRNSVLNSLIYRGAEHFIINPCCFENKFIKTDVSSH